METKTFGIGRVSEICQPYVPLLVMTNRSSSHWLFRQRDKVGMAMLPSFKQETMQRGVEGALQLSSTYKGFTYNTLMDTVSVIRNQWGDRLQNFNVGPGMRLLNLCGTIQTG